MSKNNNLKNDTGHKVDAVSAKNSTDSKLDGIIVSMFKNCKSNEPRNANLFSICEAITSGKYAEPIKNLRDSILNGDFESAEKVKTEILPAFTPSGSFDHGRRRENLIKYNNLQVLDFDNIDENFYDASFKAAIDIPYTVFAFRSPSGDGLKILVAVNSNADQHEITFAEVSSYYESIIGLKIDRTGKDVNRLCVVSSDEKAFLNEEATFFEVKQDAGYATEAKGPYNRPVAKRISLSDFKTQFQRAIELTKNKEQFFDGNRNNFINLLANNSNRWGIPNEDALNLILNSEFCYDPDEVTSTINSAYKNLTQHNTYPLHKLDADVAIVASVAQQKFSTKKGNSLISIKTFNELEVIGKDLPPLKKLFGNFILDKSTTLFPSERGVGKTLLAMQIACSIANDDKEFLREQIELNGNVFYVNLEMSEGTIARRIESLYKGMKKNDSSPYNIFCFTSRQGFQLLLPTLTEMAKTYNPVLIVIDNLRTALDGKNNENNSEMTQIVNIVNKFKDDLDTTILLVHHLRKGSSNQMTNSDMQSGAGALSDLVDADFFLRKSGVDKNFRVLKRVKARECEEQDGAKLISLNSETLWFGYEEDGVDESMHVLDDKSTLHKEKRKEKVLQMITNGVSDANIAKEVGGDRSSIWRIRQKLSK